MSSGLTQALSLTHDTWIHPNSLTLMISGAIEQGASLLQLKDSKQFNEQILVWAVKHSEENDRITEVIKLYNLAGNYSTVVACLAQALSNTISRPSPKEKDQALEQTAVDIIRHYERMNRAAGKDREAVVRLLRIREAKDQIATGKPEVAIDIMESTELIPLSGDVAKITRRAEEFKDLHKALQRNLQAYLPLTMEALAGVHQKVKSSVIPDATRQMVSTVFATGEGRTDVCLDAYCPSTQVKVIDDLCGHS
ncbi:Nuclear pore complex protein Nup93 [Termitomyces sp. J132]|nr:Nuclear pore complex protein Nup93 [Termitomyces sp. J132]